MEQSMKGFVLHLVFHKNRLLLSRTNARFLLCVISLHWPLIQTSFHNCQFAMYGLQIADALSYIF